MDIALAFGRPDVSAFLDSIDHEQFERWVEYFQRRPQGWNALNLSTARISYYLVQTHTRRKLREQDYQMKISVQTQNAALERARWEAMSVRTALENGETIDG